LDSKDIPLISTIGIYDAPKMILPPKISRSTDGTVELTAPDTGLDVYYSLDGNAITLSSQRYQSPIAVKGALTLMAASYDPITDLMSEPARVDLDLPKGANVGAIVRGEEILIADSDAMIKADDHVIVFVSSRSQIAKVEKLFQVSASFF
jgi:alpha-L-fucosidase